MKIFLSIQVIDSAGTGLGDFYGTWISEDGNQGSEIASGIDITGGIEATRAAILASFASMIGTDLSTTIDPADICWM